MTTADLTAPGTNVEQVLREVLANPQLLRALLRIKVRPYILFHCDPVIGAGHFRTSIWKGLEIMEGLRGHTSGLVLVQNRLPSMRPDSVVTVSRQYAQSKPGR